METAAYIKVRPPTLPINIRIIRTILDNIPSCGVIPNVNPTVPTADAVSKRHFPNEIPSVTFIINAPVTNYVIYIIAIVAAFLTVSLSILLSKK